MKNYVFTKYFDNFLMLGLHTCWDNRWDEQEWKGYICLISHALNLFLSCLVALTNMSVNHTRVKGHKCLTSLLKLLLITLSFSSQIFLPSIFYGEKIFFNLLGKLSAVLWLSRSFTCQLCLVAFAQECEYLHSCVPRLIRNSPKVSMRV